MLSTFSKQVLFGEEAGNNSKSHEDGMAIPIPMLRTRQYHVVWVRQNCTH